MKLPMLLTSASAALLLCGLFYFAGRRPGYSHLRHTISELGEVGSPVARAVAYGLFLPIGLLLFGAASLAGQQAVQGLAVCVGIGYVVAAFFPCDVGSPVSGSTRQQIHNLGGAIEYIGGAYFLSQLSASDFLVRSTIVSVGAGLIFVGVILLSIPGLPLRGLIQRVMETVLFGSLILTTYLPVINN